MFGLTLHRAAQTVGLRAGTPPCALCTWKRSSRAPRASIAATVAYPAAVVPSDYSTFFQTTASAAAALIGLLFVAVSIEPHATVADDAPADRRGESANTFTALVNALLISLWALLPDAHFALPVIGVAAGSIAATLLLGWDVMHDPSGVVDLRWRATLLGGSVIIYGWQLYEGIVLARSPGARSAVGAIANLLVVVFALSVSRAWELLGARRYSIPGLLARRRRPPPP